MIRVVCSTCRSQFNTPDQYAGRRATCPNCKSPIVVPAAAAASGLPPIPASYPAGTVAAGTAGHGGLAIAALVCGIVSFVLSVAASFPCLGCFILPVAAPTALGGIVCGIIALVTAKKANRKTGMAIIGLALSVLAIIWAPLVFFLFLGGLSALGAGAASMPGGF